ncbi:hypothetical protein [Nitrososphaera sp.]|uniref:hypothetical protein n=1 Tax=Nitrososphaera sp. TaxID=1971748 RepID=UPI001856BC41|nr:hypothetical protein [Nitrososphaera sp.]NWG37458.1 hypothetical protein [Nitrososphaera sp.]
MSEIGTFILDFQTTDFGSDEKIANDFIAGLQSACQLENQYALDPPMERAGWAFAKLFFAGQFVERIYSVNSYEIDRSKGKKFKDKFINWLASQLKNRGCTAQIKAAPEMKQF